MQKVIQFLKEVRVEFKNITWPQKEALFDLTIVVISISIVISLILGGFDYLFTQSFSLLGQQTNKTNVGQVSSPSAIISTTPVVSTNPLPTIKLVPPTKTITK
jgi:preprotein translocase subunit SecE